MSKRAEFLQLDASDDAVMVRDRIARMRGQKILLIWPEEGTALTRKLDIVLIQREAMRRSIRLALVTHDPRVIKHAGELNISTFETIGASERRRWKRGRSKVFTNRFHRPKDEPEADELMEVASRVRASKRRGSRLFRSLSRSVVLALLAAVTLATSAVVVPAATVTLTPAQSVVQISVDVVADPEADEVDVENGVIPATRLRVEVEEFGTVETTGVRDVVDVPATGSVVFANQTNQTVNIPQGTTVSTSAGTPVLFRTTTPGSVVGGVGNQLELPIEALQDSAGERSNIASGLVNTVVGPLGDRLTVRNLAPTTGGESRSVPAVSPLDRERLLSTVRQQIQARAFTEIRPRLSANQFIIEETIRIAEERDDWINFSAGVGDAAPTLTLNMRAIVEAFAADEQLGRQVAFTQLAGQIPREHRIAPDTVTYERGPTRIDPDTGQIRFTMTGASVVSEGVNVAALKNRLAGKSLENAREYILAEVALAAGTAPEIRLTPDWFGRMPLLPLRIEVRLEEAGAEETRP